MLVRPLRAGDTERVQQFVRRLSARSRLERFFAPLAELSPKQLERITSGSGLSLAALDEQGSIVALAEYACGDPGRAEIALVVADAWQGRGLGGRLLAVLLEHARQAGLSRLEGVTRTGNDAMRGLATKLGFGLRRDADPRLVRLERAVGA
jgi:acetyltransferase